VQHLEKESKGTHFPIIHLSNKTHNQHNLTLAFSLLLNKKKYPPPPKKKKKIEIFYLIQGIFHSEAY
jgi:hypothetical protein